MPEKRVIGLYGANTNSNTRSLPNTDNGVLENGRASTHWKRAIVALGALYVVLGLRRAYIEISRGTPVSNAVIISVFIAGPGLIVLLHKSERIANVGGWEINPETMEVYWTQHLFEILERPRDEEPPAAEALDVYHDEDRPIIEHAIKAALEEGEPFDVEVRFHTPEEEMRWLRIQAVPETVGTDVVSLRGAAQDVTERHQRERVLERANERLRAGEGFGRISLVKSRR